MLPLFKYSLWHDPSDIKKRVLLHKQNRKKEINHKSTNEVLPLVEKKIDFFKDVIQKTIIHVQKNKFLLTYILLFVVLKLLISFYMVITFK